MTKAISMAEVAKNNSAQSAWMVIDGDVYDVTKFVKYHPGGSQLLVEYAGTDATEAFFGMHRTSILAKYQRFIIGHLDTVTVDPSRPRIVDQEKFGLLSEVPHAEPAYLQGWMSPIFTEEHKTFRLAARAWYDEHVRPVAAREAASNKTPSLEMFQKMGSAGILAAALAPSAALTKAAKAANIPCPGGIPWEKFDLYMEQILHEEHFRVGVPGYADGLHAGYTIAAPTLLNYGTPAMHTDILPDVLLGNKRICLSITEPFVGSDVAKLRTRAVRSECGKFFIVSGVKKWISGGLDSDWFVTAVRTGGPGMGGISLLLIPRVEGLTTKLIKTSYAASAGTAYVTMENVKVPVEYLLGKENQGFAPIMNNFNHERWMIVVGTMASSRQILSECILWANQRKVFGKALIQQPVIMNKIAEMAAQIEALSAWVDTVTYQMQNLPYKQQGKVLAGPIALMKYYSTRVSLMVADHSAQIFGGRAITRGGMGQNVERFARAVKYTAIYGGSEEIMQSLGVKQMLKRMPPRAML